MCITWHLLGLNCISHVIFHSWRMARSAWNCSESANLVRGLHANQITICLDPHLNKGWGWRCLTSLSPPVKYFTERSKAVLLWWIFYVFCSVLCLLCLCARLFICALWSPAKKGLTSWLSFVVSNCEFVTFPLASWVRCCTWLYRFLIFAPLLTMVR